VTEAQVQIENPEPAAKPLDPDTKPPWWRDEPGHVFGAKAGVRSSYSTAKRS
jgi:hypothetical protein